MCEVRYGHSDSFHSRFINSKKNAEKFLEKQSDLAHKRKDIGWTGALYYDGWLVYYVREWG